MNISKSSWHYRLIRWLNRWPEDNLCPYVRQIIYACLTVLGSGLALAALGVAVLIVLSYPVWQFFFYFGDMSDMAITFSFFIYGLIGITALKIYRADYYNYYGFKPKPGWEWLHTDIFAFLDPLIEKFQARRFAIRTTKKEPGIFRQRIRAGHDQICPHLDFED